MDDANGILIGLCAIMNVATLLVASMAVSDFWRTRDAIEARLFRIENGLKAVERKIDGDGTVDDGR